jgi:dephospho-CoA kinase
MHFGASFRRADGTLDRGALRPPRVWGTRPHGRASESILHPLIRGAAQREIGGWISPYGVLVVPLLLERTGGTPVDRVLVVDCPRKSRFGASSRGAASPAEVRAIMATQLLSPIGCSGPTMFRQRGRGGGDRPAGRGARSSLSELATCGAPRLTQT